MSNQENYDEFLSGRKKITSIVAACSIVAIIVIACIIAFAISRGSNESQVAKEENKKQEKVEQVDPNSEFVAGVTNTATQVIENKNEILSNEVANTNSVLNTTTNTTNTNTVVEKTPLLEGYTAADETVYATTTVHVRQSPSTESESIGSLFAEQSVERIGIGKDGWSKVIYKDKEAYVFSEYLTTEKPPERPKIEVSIRGESTVDPNKSMVCLTFDDGPNPSSSNRILDVLEAHNVRATFFDLGNLMKAYPDTVKREEEIGCEVASHTYSHKNLNTLSYDAVQSEQDKTEEQMQDILGHTSKLIRPPYGNANTTVRNALENYGLIGWDIDTLDWKSKNANSVLAEVRKFSDYDGRIILMHSIYDSTVQAVETLVPELLEKGYQLVTVSEMIKYKGVELEGGKLYYNFRDE